jgi:hypothetical protein
VIAESDDPTDAATNAAANDKFGAAMGASFESRPSCP